MNDELALMWLHDLLGKLERKPPVEDPAEYRRIQAVLHAIEVIKWRIRLLRKMDIGKEDDDGRT